MRAETFGDVMTEKHAVDRGTLEKRNRLRGEFIS
jgi:hypothetical protein